MRRTPRLLAALLLPSLAFGQGSSEALKLLEGNGLPFDFMGVSTALTGNRVLLGAHRDGTSGRVHGFQSVTGVQVATYAPNDGSFDNWFGWDLDADSGRMVVGAYLDDQASEGAGAAYLMDIQTGQTIAKLLASDAAPNDYAGYSVAIDGTHVAVGAVGVGDSVGAVYVFNTAGQELFKLVPPNPIPNNLFGTAVSISDNTLAVSATGDSTQGANAGAVYLYDLPSGQPLGKLLAQDGAPGNRFGEDLDIDGNRLVIGAPGDTVNGALSGSAYLFDVATQQQTSKLLPTDGDNAPNAVFGISVGVGLDAVVVGAYLESSIAEKAGAAYVFHPETGLQRAKLTASDATAGDYFGLSVAVSSTRPTAIVGAIFASNGSVKTGAGYLFDLDAVDTTAYCFGEDCPCGNDDLDAGCENSTQAGARLEASGSASVGNDELVLSVTQLPPNQFGLLFMGPGSTSSPFGAGLLCVGAGTGSLCRFAPTGTGALGAFDLGPDLAALSATLDPACAISSGDTWHFQAWYRDPLGPCGQAFNFSNALMVRFQP